MSSLNSNSVWEKNNILSKIKDKINSKRKSNKNILTFEKSLIY